jgi:hypothetical protein
MHQGLREKKAPAKEHEKAKSQETVSCIRATQSEERTAKRDTKHANPGPEQDQRNN